jgi:cell division protein FtsW (lipid II flippase)
MTAPPSPIIVRVIGPETDTLTIGDVILQALGLTGVITLIALVLGAILGGLFIYLRVRRPDNSFNGETSGELSLHLN